MHTINTPNAPKAIGPYSQGVISGSLVFTSGQLPLDPFSGNLITADIKKAAAQALNNVKAVLEQAGTGMDKVVKVTIYMKDLSEFAAVNEVYAAYFADKYPARSTIQVVRLPLDALIEIEAVAEL